MDTRRFLLEMHSLAHSPAVGGESTHRTEKPVPDDVWGSVTEAQLRRTLDGHTSIAWLIWHMARAEDMGVNAIVRDVPEVFDRDGWQSKLGVELRHAGTGMSHEEAMAMSDALDVAALIDYRDAVGRETRAWLKGVDLDTLEEARGDYGERVLHSHDFLERVMRWAESYFPGKSAGWFFMRLALWHNFFHLGHMDHVLRGVGYDFRTRRA